jgi:acetylglutamate kinase
MMNQYASPLDGGLIVVKYGGNAMPVDGAPDPLLAELAELWRTGLQIVLVHGGGPEIDRWLALRGVTTERVDGLRVTDAITLETTEAVLCGTVNKRIVRACAALGLPAVGVSGEDAHTLIAERAASASGADLGFVGNVVACNVKLLRTLLGYGFLPVVAPLALNDAATTAYNVNADLAAGAIAAALHASAFLAVTNVPRILRNPDDPSSGIDRLTIAEAREFLTTDACRSSMKPKLEAAIASVAGGASAAYICDARPGAIRNALSAGEATIIAA